MVDPNEKVAVTLPRRQWDALATSMADLRGSILVDAPAEMVELALGAVDRINEALGFDSEH